MAAAAPTNEESAPPALGERYRVSVRVDKSRLSVPQRQVTTASGALVVYSQRIPTVEGTRAAPRDEQWVPLGRDGLLEGDLLARFVNLLPEVEVAE